MALCLSRKIPEPQPPFRGAFHDFGKARRNLAVTDNQVVSGMRIKRNLSITKKAENYSGLYFKVIIDPEF